MGERAESADAEAEANGGASNCHDYNQIRDE
jgi:hypothetical protein